MAVSPVFGPPHHMRPPEIMLVTWGLCFIASRSEAPTQKGRNFAQPIEVGKEIVTRKRRRSSASTATLAAEGFEEEQPYWNTAGRNQQSEATPGSFRVIPPVSDTIFSGREGFYSVLACTRALSCVKAS